MRFFETIARREDENLDEIVLYPEGLFYKAYERSAFACVSRVSPFKASKKMVKYCGRDLVSIGFPAEVLTRYFPGAPQPLPDGSVVIKLAEPIDSAACEAWKNTLPLKKRQPRGSHQQLRLLKKTEPTGTLFLRPSETPPDETSVALKTGTTGAEQPAQATGGRGAVEDRTCRPGEGPGVTPGLHEAPGGKGGMEHSGTLNRLPEARGAAGTIDTRAEAREIIGTPGARAGTSGTNGLQSALPSDRGTEPKGERLWSRLTGIFRRHLRRTGAEKRPKLLGNQVITDYDGEALPPVSVTFVGALPEGTFPEAGRHARAYGAGTAASGESCAKAGPGSPDIEVSGVGAETDRLSGRPGTGASRAATGSGRAGDGAGRGPLARVLAASRLSAGRPDAKTERLVRLIREFRLEAATPVECVLFVADLKKEIDGYL